MSLWFYDWYQKVHVSHVVKTDFLGSAKRMAGKAAAHGLQMALGSTGLGSNTCWKWEMGRYKAYGFCFHYRPSPGQGWHALVSVKRTCIVLYKVYMLSWPCTSQKWNWETNKSECTCSVSAQTNSPSGPYQHTSTLITLWRSAEHRLPAVAVTFYHARKLLANH